MYEESSRWANAEIPVECIASFSGVFSFILLVALPLAIFLTWLTIRLYRNKISRVMRKISPEATENKTAGEIPGSSRRPPPNALSLQTFDDYASIKATDESRLSSKRLRRTSTAYALAGLAQAMVVSALTFLLSNTEFLPVRFASTVFLYLWPIIPTLILTSVSDPRVKWLSLGGYFLLLFSLDIGLNLSGIMQGQGIGALIQVWMIWMGPPSLLLWLLSNRAWRSVGLLAYLVAALLVTGWLLATQGLACLALTLQDVSIWANCSVLLKS